MKQLVMLATLTALSGLVNVAEAAAVADTIGFPRLDIQTVTGVDSAMTGTMNSSGSMLDIDASVVAVILNDASEFVPLSADFSLHAEYSYSDSAYAHHFTNGTLRVGEVGSEYLTAIFSDLVVYAHPTNGMGSFASDLTFTGGE